MPKKPKKQHTTFYMDPNPWKKPTKAPKEPKPVEDTVKSETTQITEPIWYPPSIPLSMMRDYVRSFIYPSMEEKADRYIKQYPGAATVDLMVAFANDERRQRDKAHKYEIEEYQLTVESCKTANTSLGTENHYLRKEANQLRARLAEQQSQRERITSCSIVHTERVRLFREE